MNGRCAVGELRQKFESRLSEKVKHILIECDFNNSANRYYYCDLERKEDFNLGVINGAWYMFFEDFESQQSKIEQLEKLLAQMKHINDEQNKNLANAFKTIEIQQKFDADSQGAIACLTEMNGRLKREKTEITRLVQSLRNEFDVWDYCPQVERQIELLEKACRGECDKT